MGSLESRHIETISINMKGLFILQSWSQTEREKRTNIGSLTNSQLCINQQVLNKLCMIEIMVYIILFFKIHWFPRKRGRGIEKEKHPFFCSTCLCIHWFIPVCTRTGIQTETLACWNNAPNNWVYQRGSRSLFIFNKKDAEDPLVPFSHLCLSINPTRLDLLCLGLY